MPKIFLSPSTQEWNTYVNGSNEEAVMNELADRIEPYLRSSGIGFARNDPSRNVQGAIADSNSGYYDAHVALHTNAAGESNKGNVRGIDIYYAPGAYNAEQLAEITAKNLATIYPLPDKSRAISSSALGELTETRADAILAEIGYHDNIQDANWIKGNLGPIARQIVKSLTEYFGMPFIEPVPVRTGTVSAGGGNLNIRSKPTTSSDIVGTIPSGASVPIYGNSNGWYSTYYNGVAGFISGEYVK
jgi:N-acetylmuramoyl-L-alanine amidase